MHGKYNKILPECVPIAEKYNRKYQSTFHAGKNTTHHFFSVFFKQPEYNKNTTQEMKISYNTKIIHENTTSIKHINTEKLSKGEEVRVRPTRGKGLSRYQVMVISQGVMYGQNVPVV